MKKMMCPKISVLLAAIALLQLSGLGQDARVKLIDRFAAAKHKFHNFDGNVLVAESGKVIYRRSFGSADLRLRKPLRDESVFNLASISKQFTAAAVMLCVERGLLGLDDPLSKYLPEVPYPGVSIRQMLTHTSGLPEQNELMYKYWTSERAVTNADMLDHLVRYKPEIAFKPGESFKYCNTNYSLLAMVVEKITGSRFQDFVSGIIFIPLDMRQTYFLNPTGANYRTIPDQVENYIFDAETGKFLPPDEIAQMKKAMPLLGLIGAGNVYSTTGDLLKWQESLKTARILKRESIELMEMPHVKANVDGSDAYGFGMAIKSIYDDTKIFHNGGTLGFWNSLQYFKKADRTIIVLSNNEGEKQLTNAIAAILFGQGVALPSTHTAIRLGDVDLLRFVGTYQAAGGNSFNVEKRDGKLFRVVANGEPKELKAESKTKLFYDDGSDRQLELIFDNRQKVKQVFFISQGIKIELKKLAGN
jgi:CubicO group peptidase (beta-lactamase class C family)